jgi:hypothetical protein
LGYGCHLSIIHSNSQHLLPLLLSSDHITLLHPLPSLSSLVLSDQFGVLYFLKLSPDKKGID